VPAGLLVASCGEEAALASEVAGVPEQVVAVGDDWREVGIAELVGLVVYPAEAVAGLDSCAYRDLERLGYIGLAWGIAMLRTRLMNGARLDEPIFADLRGGYRDPANTRRDLREARSPIGGETRQELGRSLRKVRRAAGLSQTDTAVRLGWAQSRVSLIETARVRLDLVDAAALLDLYRVSRTGRAELLEVAGQAAEGSQADALAWITSHSFRRRRQRSWTTQGRAPGRSRTSSVTRGRR
jgi:transcriptional regulator with XRE-family HTH domain